jgi:Protein of unknown function (DUF3037)
MIETLTSRYMYSLVRCVPEPRTGEFVNVGALAGSEVLGDWSARQVANMARASKLGASDAVLQAATGFFARTWELIELNENEMETGRLPLLTDEWLRDCHRDFRNVVQLTAPMPVIAESAQQALELVLDSLVTDPVRQTRGLTKTRLVSSILEAFAKSQLNASLYKRPDLYVGEKLHTTIDVVAKSPRAMVLTQAWSFQNANPDQVTDSVKAWGFAVSRLRDHDAARLMTGSGPESLEVSDDVQVNVIIAEPENASQMSAYEEATEVFKSVDAKLYAYADVGAAADRTRELLLV